MMSLEENTNPCHCRHSYQFVEALTTEEDIYKELWARKQQVKSVSHFRFSFQKA
jgi:hypothetical protein